jgi:multidrug efflux pump
MARPASIYMESVTQANGIGQITISFEPGTNPDLAQVDVQNRLARATPRLPPAVTQQGVRVEKGALQLPAVHHPVLGRSPTSRRWTWATTRRARAARDPAHPGVGQAQLFGTEAAMRVWIDPEKLVATTCPPPT